MTGKHAPGSTVLIMGVSKWATEQTLFKVDHTKISVTEGLLTVCFCSHFINCLTRKQLEFHWHTSRYNSTLFIYVYSLTGTWQIIINNWAFLIYKSYCHESWNILCLCSLMDNVKPKGWSQLSRTIGCSLHNGAGTQISYKVLTALCL